MNQILSVEMSNNKKSTRAKGNKKASTKSVVIFFGIILIILGIVMALLGAYRMLTNTDESNTEDNTRPKIDISQNATTLDIEIYSDYEISKARYRWNQGAFEEVSGDGTNSLEFNTKVPGGSNTFEIEATDIQGTTTTYSNSYIGPDELQAGLGFDEVKDKFSNDKDKLKIKFEDQKVIKNVSYYYDENEQETQKVEINNTKVEVEIPIMQGEHNLTVVAEYEDGTTREVSKKIYFPVVEAVQVTADGSGFLLKASDERGITNIKMNFNGNESEETINNNTFEKTLPLQNGRNWLILTVYNKDGVSITRRTVYEKK